MMTGKSFLSLSAYNTKLYKKEANTVFLRFFGYYHNHRFNQEKVVLRRKRVNSVAPRRIGAYTGTRIFFLVLIFNAGRSFCQTFIEMIRFKTISCA